MADELEMWRSAARARQVENRKLSALNRKLRKELSEMLAKLSETHDEVRRCRLQIAHLEEQRDPRDSLLHATETILRTADTIAKAAAIREESQRIRDEVRANREAIAERWFWHNSETTPPTNGQYPRK